LVLVFQFMLLAPSLTSNLAKVPYRQHKRFEALMAYVDDRTAEKEAVYEEENRKAIDYVTHQKLMNLGIPFAVLLLIEGIGFDYLFWHDGNRKSKAS